MHKILYTFVIAFSYTTYVQPLTVNSTVLKNNATGKQVLLLGEIHTLYARQTLTDTQQAAYDAVEQQQKQSFAKLADNLLALNSEKGSQAVVITEIGPNTLGRLLEEETGEVPAEDQRDETIQVMPRAFLKTVLAPAATVDEKLARYQSSVTPFNDVPAASFVLSNGLRWIVGDTMRGEQDKFLCFTVYKHWESILESIANKEDMPEALSSLTIDYVQEYIKTWHDTFVSYAIDDPYAQEIMATIDQAVQAGNLSPSDHIAKVHEYLRTHDDVAVCDVLGNNILKFLSLKTDLELCTYIKAFEQDPKLNQLIINFGSAHTQTAKELLSNAGYQVVEQAGCDVSEPTTAEDVQEQTMQALAFLEKHPDLVRWNAL